MLNFIETLIQIKAKIRSINIDLLDEELQNPSKLIKTSITDLIDQLKPEMETTISTKMISDQNTPEEFVETLRNTVKIIETQLQNCKKTVPEHIKLREMMSRLADCLSKIPDDLDKTCPLSDQKLFDIIKSGDIPIILENNFFCFYSFQSTYYESSAAPTCLFRYLQTIEPDEQLSDQEAIKKHNDYHSATNDTSYLTPKIVNLETFKRMINPITLIPFSNNDIQTIIKMMHDLKNDIPYIHSEKTERYVPEKKTRKAKSVITSHHRALSTSVTDSFSDSFNNLALEDYILDRNLERFQFEDNKDCFYQAVSLYLNEETRFLRNIIAAHIDANRDYYSRFFKTSNNNQLNKTINDIHEGLRWADNIEITALSNLLDRPIIIIDTDNIIKNPGEILIHDGDPIFIYHKGGNHYEPLMLKNGTDVKALVDRLITKTKLTKKRLKKGDQINFDLLFDQDSAEDNSRQCEIDSIESNDVSPTICSEPDMRTKVENQNHDTNMLNAVRNVIHTESTKQVLNLLNNSTDYLEREIIKQLTDNDCLPTEVLDIIIENTNNKRHTYIKRLMIIRNWLLRISQKKQKEKLAIALKCLDLNEAEFKEFIINNSSDIIITSKDLFRFISEFPIEKQTALLQENNLRKGVIEKCLNNDNSLIDFLRSTQKNNHWELIVSSLGKQLIQKHINTPISIIRCIKDLTPRNWHIILRIIGHYNTIKIIKNSKILALILESCNAENQKTLIEYLGNHWLASLIDDFKDLHNIFDSLKNDNYQLFFTMLNNKTKNLINTSSLYSTLFLNKTLVEQLVLFKALDNQLEIRTTSQLLRLLSVMHDPCQKKLLDKIHSNLKFIINDMNSLLAVLMSLNDKFKILWLNKLGTKFFNQLFPPPDYIIDLLKIIKPTHWEELFTILPKRDNAGLLQLSSQKSIRFLSNLSTPDQILLLNIIEANGFLRINYFFDLEGLIGALSVDAQRKLFSLLGKENLSRIFKTALSLTSILPELSLEIRQHLFTLLGFEFIGKIITAPDDLRFICMELCDEDQSKLVKHIEPKTLSSIIAKTASSLHRINFLSLKIIDQIIRIINNVESDNLTMSLDDESTTTDTTPQDMDIEDPIEENRIINGLIIQKVSIDGSCFYHAVSLYLNLSVKNLRKLIAGKIEKDREKYRPFITLPENKTLDDYIEDIRTSNEWAGELEITVLSKILNRPIVVLGPDGMIRNRNDVIQHTGEPIFVSYNGLNHYDALLLKEDYVGKTVLEKLLNNRSARCKFTSDSRLTFK